MEERTTTNQEPQKRVEPTTSKRWQTPILTFVGRVSDLVKGGGKSGGQADSDPLFTRKRGVG